MRRDSETKMTLSLHLASNRFLTTNKRRIMRFSALLITTIILFTTLPVDTLADTTESYTIQDFNNTNSENEGDTTYDDAVKTQTFSLLGSLRERINDFFKKRGLQRREVIPLHIVTNYSGFEKIKKIKLVRPTSIDVDNDGDFDIRVWWFNRPAIDLHPPAIALKTTFVIRRLPGMENIKYDDFSIYIEYYPRVITKFFYLTKDIDRIRLGYQSPKTEEIPKTCVISDKIIPHFLYPMKKATHKISIDPGSIAGEHQLNLVVALTDLGNGTSIYDTDLGNDTGVYKFVDELTMQMNYTPAVKITDITLEKTKQKLIGKGQTLKITRTEKEPTNVTLHIRELYSSLFLTGFRILESGSITVEDIPKEIMLSWVIGRNGYLEMDTYNDKTGRVTAKINDALLIGFIPETTFQGRVSWENRTLIGVIIKDVFNLRFDVYNSLKMRNLSVKYKTQYLDNYTYSNNSRLYTFTGEINASKLSLDLDAGVEFGNALVWYWLLPVIDSDNTAIELHNLQMIAEDLHMYTKISEQPFNVSKPRADSHSLKDDNTTTGTTIRTRQHINYLKFSGEDVHLFLTGFSAINITNKFEGKIKLYMENASTVQNQTNTCYYATGTKVTSTETKTAFSYLNFSTSALISTFDVFTINNKKDFTSILGSNFDVAGSLKVNEFYRRNNQNSITTIENISITGNLSGSMRDRFNSTTSSTSTNLKGVGEIHLDKIHVQDIMYNNVFTIGSINILSNVSFYIWEYLDKNTYENVFITEGNGTIHVSDFFLGDNYNNLSIETIHISGSISAYIQHSEETNKFRIDHCQRNGSLLINNFNSTSGFNNYLHISRVHTRGDFVLTILPPQNNPYYQGIRFEGDAYLNITGVDSSIPTWNALDSILINANGDLQVEHWKDSESSDRHLLINSEHGFTTYLFSIQFDTGLNYDITRSFTSAPFKISPGYFYLVSHLQGMDDGMIFIDSSPLHIENGKFTYWSETFNGWGIRLTLPEYFDANGWCLQWDWIDLQYPDILLPINWRVSGSKTGRISIALSGNGENWYRFWPIVGSDSSNNKLVENQVSNQENLNQYNKEIEGENEYE